MSRSIEEPLRQIVANAGEDAAVVLADVKKGKGTYGYNAATGEYGDMLEMGILDPAKVTRERRPQAPDARPGRHSLFRCALMSPIVAAERRPTVAA